MADKTTTWHISTNLQGGFCPVYFKNSYPTYGNLNQMSAMNNVNLTDPNLITQGPLMVSLEDATTTFSGKFSLPRSFLRIAIDEATSYCIGNNTLFKLSSGAVRNDGFFPYTINKTSVTGEDGEDVFYWKGKLYGTYNHSGGQGDILELTPNSPSVVVDWGSTKPENKETLQNAPHQALNGGDDDVYIANGNYIARLCYTDSTPYFFDAQALDFWQDSEVSTLTWNYNRVIIGVNRPNITGAIYNQSGIYTWNGVSDSWEGDPIEVNGRIGALFTKNGITFCWWQESGQSDVYNFGYISDKLNPIKQFQGNLPLYYQVGEYKGFVAWLSGSNTTGGLVYLWGPSDNEVPTKAFQFVETLFPTVGGIGTPFGELLVSSNYTISYTVEKPSTTKFDSDCSFKTIVFNKDSSGQPLSGPGFKSQIDRIQVEIEPLSEGAWLIPTLTYDKAKSTLLLPAIKPSFGSPTIINLGSQFPQVEDFRLDFDATTASPTQPVRIRNLFIQGHFINNN